MALRPDPTLSRPARAYPHVTQVTDPNAQTSLRLLWDRVATMEAAHTTLTDLLATAQSTITDLQGRLETAEGNIQATQLVAAKATSASAPGPGAGNTPQQPQVGDQLGAPIDQSQGFAVARDALSAQSGFLNAGPNGDTSDGFPGDPYTAGQIVGGTANEFPALLAVAVDQATRDANRAQLIGRMLWHLNKVGTTCGLPTGASGGLLNCLVVVLSKIPTLYQVTGPQVYTIPMTVQMSLSTFPPPAWTPSGGIPD